LGGGDAVLEAGEDFAAVVVEGAAEAAEGPLGVDEDVDEAALLGGSGVEAVEVDGGKGIDC